MSTECFPSAVKAPFVFLNCAFDEVLPDPNPRIFVSSSTRGDYPVDSSSISCKFVLEGEEVYTVNGRAHRLLAGDFIIVDSGAGGDLAIPQSGRTIAISAFFGAAAGKSLLPGYGPVHRPTKLSPLGQMLRATAAACARDPASRPSDATPFLQNFQRAATALALVTYERLNMVQLSKPRSRQDLLTRIEAAQAFLEVNVERKLTLLEVARAAGMSAFHLNRHFAAVFGEPPMRYHRRLRLQWAARLLEAGAISPAGAAELLDYCDVPTFGRAFKIVTGTTPGAVAESSR